MVDNVAASPGLGSPSVRPAGASWSMSAPMPSGISSAFPIWREAGKQAVLIPWQVYPACR